MKTENMKYLYHGNMVQHLMVEVGVEMWHTQLASSVTCHIKTLRDVSTLRSDKKFEQFIALIQRQDRHIS